MNWLDRLMPAKIRTDSSERKSVPEGLWTKCDQCNAVLYRAELERSLEVCPKCGSHRRIGARARLDGFLDAGERVEIAPTLEASDPLRFKDTRRYRERLQQAQSESEEKEALIAMQGSLLEMPVVACAFDFAFMGGSMGSVVGEKFVRAVDVALGNARPFICFTASGGARMQEGLFSLMQMAKTSAALARLAERGLPYISVLTHPTMGGVAASLAMLGDVNIGEPQARIGFAGPRVIEQTVRQTLPQGFQHAEFLLQHGGLDMIVDRREMRSKIHGLLAMLLLQPAAASAG